MIIPVLLSGGVGSRLWPVSRELRPKQFLPLIDDSLSMLQETAGRLNGIESMAAPITVCNENHRFLVAEQLKSIDRSGRIILEPVGRNTAPAIALAALQAIKDHPDEDPCLLVLPADHVMLSTSAFLEVVDLAVAQAKQGKLVTFGVVPNKAETGYGYIEQGQAIDANAFDIAQFVEKPNAATAEEYLQSGNYLWNSGMFLLSANAFVAELEKFAPLMYQTVVKAFEAAATDLDFIRIDQALFEQVPEDSIDYAVMEKTELGVVYPLDCGWSDVGSWSALWEVGDKDANGNVLKGDVIAVDTHNSFIRSDGRLVATLGLKDAVVVETSDAVLVADQAHVQDIKKIVNQLKLAKRSEIHAHKEVFRPWGSYESLVETDRFQVKRIVVNPGARLSLQMHHHRAEHWVVVKGTAEVTCGDAVTMLGEDQSTYIPLGHKHRLANPGVIPLEIIEVQSGSYLGEDDIVRFEDIYGR